MERSAQGRADFIFGAITAVASIAAFVHTFADRYTSEFLFGDVSTMFVPRLLLGLIVLLAVGLMLKGIRDREGGRLPEIAIGRTVAVFSACVLSIAGVWYIGFLIAMPVGVFLVGWTMGYSNKLVLAGTAVAAPLLTWVILGKLAQVAFPTGTFF